MQLAYRLVKLDRAFAFQVSSQSEGLTKHLVKHQPFKASNGWRIRTDQVPEIDILRKTVYVQGKNNSYKDRPVIVWDVPNRKRDKLMNEIDMALQEYLAIAVPKEESTIIWPSNEAYSHYISTSNSYVRYVQL